LRSDSGLQLLILDAGLTIEGGTWQDEHLVLNDGDSVRVAPSQLRWVHQGEAPKPSELSMVNLPVYLNNDRSDVMFTVDLPVDGASANFVAMRAVCLTAGG